MARNNTVTVNLIGDADRLRQTFKDAGDSADSMQSKFKATGDKMESIGRKMTAAVTLPIVGIGVAAFKAASDTNESMSKVGVVFGEQAREIEKWAATAAKSLGMSRQEALEAAGTFGNLTKALGLPTDAAVKTSKGLVNLSSDLASFNNANPAEVLEALRSGLLGEAEPLRKFGVSLSAARIEAEALNMGLAKGSVDMLKVKTATAALEAAQRNLTTAVKEHGAGSAQAAQAQLQVEVAQRKVEKAMEGGKVVLTDAAKAQAAYSIIMKDTTLAQGDFARTADGAANQQRITTAQFKDAAAVLGQQLLPVGQQIIEFVSGLATRFGELSPQTQRVILIAAGLLAILGPIVGVIGTLVTVVGALGAVMTFLAANPIVLIIAGIAALVAGFVWAYKNVDWFREGVHATFRGIAAAAQWVGGVFASVWNGIVAGFVWVRDTLRSIANWLIGNVYNRMIDGVNQVIRGMNLVNVGADIPSIPRIPALAEGGIVTKPTIALIGEAGPEAVVPLSRSGVGGPNVTINFNGPVNDPDQVTEVLNRFFSRGGQLTNGRGGTLAPT